MTLIVTLKERVRLTIPAWIAKNEDHVHAASVKDAELSYGRGIQRYQLR